MRCMRWVSTVFTLRAQHLGDSTVRVAAGDELQDLVLAVGEGHFAGARPAPRRRPGRRRRSRGRYRARCTNRRRDLLREVRLARRGRAHRRAQLLAAGALEDVPDGPGLERRPDHVELRARRQHEHRRRRLSGAICRVASIPSSPTSETSIRTTAGVDGAYGEDGVAPSVHLRHDLNVPLYLQEELEPFSQRSVVLCQDQTLTACMKDSKGVRRPDIVPESAPATGSNPEYPEVSPSNR